VEEVKSFFTFGVLLSVAALTQAQTVCVGTVKQCQKAQSKLCAIPAERNLDARSADEIRGSIEDATGEPLISLQEQYRVKVGNAATGRFFYSASLDSGGRFRIATRNKSIDRLIVVKIVNGSAQRFGFLQPSFMRCVGARLCELNIVLQPAPTDNPADQCPPK
jgi:hypothetical protein